MVQSEDPEQRPPQDAREREIIQEVLLGYIGDIVRWLCLIFQMVSVPRIPQTSKVKVERRVSELAWLGWRPPGGPSPSHATCDCHYRRQFVVIMKQNKSEYFGSYDACQAEGSS
ncbi:hypothetical protein RR46_13679 [Papilio xuthus]|uniref:Uncharacterized protein n=1 Tax=Papilio xuthus TaxID=66420 RepID=A0A194PHD1_PAPXU|nr:hypothetical protein RR46_13679 [Papilio xuthus]